VYIYSKTEHHDTRYRVYQPIGLYSRPTRCPVNCSDEINDKTMNASNSRITWLRSIITEGDQSSVGYKANSTIQFQPNSSVYVYKNSRVTSVKQTGLVSFTHWIEISVNNYVIPGRAGSIRHHTRMPIYMDRHRHGGRFARGK